MPRGPAGFMSIRSATIMTFVLMASICISCIQTSAEDPDLVIDGDVTWGSEEVIDGTIRIADGGTLTLLEADVSVSTGSMIVV